MQSHKTVYQTFSTQYFKTHFAKLLRDMDRGEFDAAVITSNGRNVGVFMHHPDTRK
jgi:hypothetical protein